MSRPSALKKKVAHLLRDEYEKLGIMCNIFPGDFRTADGFWRRVDVFRWQIYVELYCADRKWRREEISSWDTLTECGRHGITIDYSNRGGILHSWEAHANPPRRKLK